MVLLTVFSFYTLTGWVMVTVMTSSLQVRMSLPAAAAPAPQA